MVCQKLFLLKMLLILEISTSSSVLSFSISHAGSPM
uniref:Uncharacterized protein n=1 Tax=Anguilla anguilla TaxID=7936 RepID=A0A0E9TTY5_ANGAN